MGHTLLAPCWVMSSEGISHGAITTEYTKCVFILVNCLLLCVLFYKLLGTRATLNTLYLKLTKYFLYTLSVLHRDNALKKEEQRTHFYQKAKILHFLFIFSETPSWPSWSFAAHLSCLMLSQAQHFGCCSPASRCGCQSHVWAIWHQRVTMNYTSHHRTMAPVILFTWAAQPPQGQICCEHSLSF